MLVQSANLVVALWTSGLSKAGAWYNVVFLGFAIVLAAAGLVWTGPNLAAALGIVSAILTLAIAVVIGLTIVSAGEISRQSITGAICIYLLLGMIFMFVYGAMATLGDGDFFLQGTDGTRALRLYFSYVTLATLGYGDYTAAGQPGRSFAISESLLGQLYLVTVVALLVGRLGLAAGRRPAREDS